MNTYKRHRFPPDIISYAVWLYYRFNLSHSRYAGPKDQQQAALESMFGVSFNGTLENIVIRSWSALVGLIGVVLIYGFFSPKNRVFSISVAAFSKVVFVSLVLIYGQEFLGKAAPAIAMDCDVIILSVLYLFTVRMQSKADVSGQWKLLGAYAAVSNLFTLGRRKAGAQHYRDLRISAFTEWSRAIT